jgi:class I fructose-bisphosphate aldolase
MSATITKLQELLGTEAESLLNHECQTINKSMLTLPGVEFC